MVFWRQLSLSSAQSVVFRIEEGITKMSEIIINIERIDKIREAVLIVKNKYACEDIILSDQFIFHEKWSDYTKEFQKKTGVSLNRSDALALINCTLLGRCTKGALIDKTGIYVLNGAGDEMWSGCLDWATFAASADFAKGEAFVAKISAQPQVGLDVSGCSLSVNQALELFEGVFTAATGKTPKTNHAEENAKPHYMSKVVTYLMLIPIALGLLYGGKHVVHVKCVEAALEMRCKNVAGYKKIESVDVPWWNPANANGYDCSAKIAFSDGVKDVGFTAKRARVTDLAKDDWDVNLGFWGWLGDDYRIFDVKAK